MVGKKHSRQAGILGRPINKRGQVANPITDKIAVRFKPVLIVKMGIGGSDNAFGVFRQNLVMEGKPLSRGQRELGVERLSNIRP